jgi:hypothetical protein
MHHLGDTPTDNRLEVDGFQLQLISLPRYQAGKLNLGTNEYSPAVDYARGSKDSPMNLKEDTDKLLMETKDDG